MRKINCSFEIFPPKKQSTDFSIQNIDNILSALKTLAPPFISITFGAFGATKNNLTLKIAKLVKNKFNIKPVTHMTCIGYSKIDINEILDELIKNGVYDVLALRGDILDESPCFKDFKYASDLISYIKNYNSRFNVFGACYPEGHYESISQKSDFKFLKHKINCGVDELISQLFFDNNLYYSFLEDLEKENINTPVHAGIMPITNINQIKRMVSMCGVSIPIGLSKLLAKYENNNLDVKKMGIDYAVRQINDLVENGVDNIHIYTMNDPEVAKEITHQIIV